jgi:hypothetical protein
VPLPNFGAYPLAKAAETLGEQKEFLSERFKERAEMFRQDLRHWVAFCGA